MTSEELRDAFHYLYRDEVPALKKLSNMLPDNPVIVNIGAGSGTSGLAFMESRPDVWLFTIDIQEGDSPFGCLYAEKEVLKKAGLWNYRVTQIWGDSKTIGQSWSNDMPDMVFIDGDHSYEGCKGDIQAWIYNIKEGGIIAVHDYQKDMISPTEDGPHPKSWPGVDQAVAELLLGKYEQILRVDSLIAFRV